MIIHQIGNKKIAYDSYIIKLLEEVKKTKLDRDGDCICVVDGKVGEGKSTLAQSIAAYIDPTLDINRICFDVEDFKKCILHAEKKQAIVFDESLGGLNIRRTMSGINVTLVQFLTEIRQKNLFIVLCLPSIFDMDRSLAIQRTTFLCHVYSRNGERGFFKLFGNVKKDSLVTNDFCRKKYKYTAFCTKYGRFGEGYYVDETEYRQKKQDVLKRYFGDNTKKVSLSSDEKMLQEGKEYYEILESGVSIAELVETGVSKTAIGRAVNFYKRNVLFSEKYKKMLSGLSQKTDKTFFNPEASGEKL